jgi:predicted ATPase/class 3 adenylate cyclase
MTPSLPSGTVTFLFTDIEGSTRIADEHPDIWETVRERHHAILRGAIEAHHGYVFQIIGDAFCSAFHTTRDALHAAVEAQQKLQAEAWEQTSLQVRMGIHTGEAEPQHGDYTGYLTLARAQRVMSAAYGGQILLSDSSAALLRTELSGDISLIDLGEQRLKNLTNPERIWQSVSSGLRRDFPPLKSVNSIQNNLPVELTSFVGRETEISEVRELLETHRLVTLTGSGGTGKTRLALRVAAELLDAFKDGVWFVELAPLSVAVLVPNTVASVLGVREAQSRPLMADLLDWLSSKELLLVLDNCEHLIESCARFADAVLHASRRLYILATSREALGIAGETAYRVPPLGSPRLTAAPPTPLEEFGQYPAVRLFIERAQDSLSTFRLTDANAPAVAQICSRLDGIPLAIELAAARVKVLHAGQIAERLNDRFQLLTGGGRTALPRHQTLRSLIDWSYSLLTGPEQVLLRRLSVFAGGCTLAAAEQVCAGDELESHEILDLLTHLVDKSLVGVDEGTEESRYRMHETTRQYALEKLSESGQGERVRQQHLDFMVALTEKAEARIFGHEESSWLDRLEAELDNLRAALTCAINLDDAQAALHLVGSLYWFWWIHGYWQEAHRWLREALSVPGAQRHTRARAKALIAMGWFRYMSGENSSAQRLFEESVVIARSLGEKPILVESLPWLGFVMCMMGDYATASLVLEEGLLLSRELGDKFGTGRSLLGIGQVKLSQHNYREAQASFEESAALLRETGSKNVLSFALRRLGHIALHERNARKAFVLCSESLDLNLKLGDKRGMAGAIVGLGCIAIARGHAIDAARLFGAASALLESFGGQLTPPDQIESEACALAARAAIGEDEYGKAYAEGRAMRADEGIAYALEQAPG